MRKMIKSHYTLSVDYHFEDDLKTISDIKRLVEQTEMQQKLYCIYMNHNKSFNGRSLNSKVCNNDWY